MGITASKHSQSVDMPSHSARLPPLKSLTLGQIAAGLDSRDFTVEHLIKAHLEHIARYDVDLHAVLQLNPRALEIAQQLDVELLRSGRRGPLFGVPILVKDNVVTNEPGLEATAGSLALLGAKPARENPAVTLLRAAGAVLLGTTNCSEWANFRSRPSDGGWSARGGQTFGAYHDRQDPSGSSSGSAVAVDMGFCVMAIGTETSGSIVLPATQASIIGIKPTVGLTSRDAVIPISPQQDTLGVMARTLDDAATMLSIIASPDVEHDPKTADFPFDAIPDYKHAATLKTLLPLRIGIPRDAFKGVNEAALDLFESRVVGPLRDQYKITMVDCSFPGLARYGGLSPKELTNYMAGEFHDALPAYLDKLVTNPQNIVDMESLCAFIVSTPGEEYGEEDALGDGSEEAPAKKAGDEMKSKAKGAVDSTRPPRRNIKIFEQTLQTTRDSPAFLSAKANAAYFAGVGGIQGALEGRKYGSERPHGFNDHEPVDALLLPTSAIAVNYFAGCEGHPQINVPMGYYGPDTAVEYNETGRLVRTGPNVPFGVSVVGRKFSEAETLLPLCSAIEKLTQARSEAENRRLPHLRG